MTVGKLVDKMGLHSVFSAHVQEAEGAPKPLVGGISPPISSSSKDTLPTGGNKGEPLPADMDFACESRAAFGDQVLKSNVQGSCCRLLEAAYVWARVVS